MQMDVLKNLFKQMILFSGILLIFTCRAHYSVESGLNVLAEGTIHWNLAYIYLQSALFSGIWLKCTSRAHYSVESVSLKCAAVHDCTEL